MELFVFLEIRASGLHGIGRANMANAHYLGVSQQCG
jgi:hypothetical protein